MTHIDQLIDPAGETPGTLEYIGTAEELAEAGGGFSIRHIDEMPEHESEFLPAAGLHAGLQELALLAAYESLQPSPRRPGEHRK